MAVRLTPLRTGWLPRPRHAERIKTRLEAARSRAAGVFYAERKPSTLMRINIATTQDAAFWKKYSEMVRAT